MTGVQTCALPICRFGFARPRKQAEGGTDGKYQGDGDDGQGIHVGWVDGVVAMLFPPLAGRGL